MIVAEYNGASGVLAHAFTVPEGVTADQTMLAACIQGDASVQTVTFTSSNASAIFSQLDAVSGASGRLYVIVGYNLVAGDTVTATLSSGKQFHISQVYDTYSYSSLVSNIKTSNSTVITSPALSPASGQSVRLIGMARSGTAGLTQSLSSSSGSVVSINTSYDSSSDLPLAHSIIGSYTASNGNARTATATTSGNTTTGYIAQMLMTPVNPPAPVASFRSASVVSTETDNIRVGVSASNVGSVHLLATSDSDEVIGAPATLSSYGWGCPIVTGLIPGKKYTISVINDYDGSTLATTQGITMTLDRKNFKALSSSCLRTNSVATNVWSAMQAENADFFELQGDLHYVDTEDETVWRTATRNQLAKTQLQNFLSTISMSYHYDNHDSPNDGNGDPSSQSSGWSWMNPAVREYFGPQLEPAGMQSTWVNGGIRFIETDQWAYRDPALSGQENDRVGKTMLGTAQRQWLFDTLSASTEPVIVWFNSFPLVPISFGGSRWRPFTDEANIIGAWLNDNPEVKEKLVCVGGDSHSVVADDGTNTLWNIPSLNASPIDRKGDSAATTAGTWNQSTNSTNPLPNYDKGYYSLMNFVWNDDQSQVTMTWQAKSSDNEVVANWSKTYSAQDTQQQANVYAIVNGQKRLVSSITIVN